MDLDTKQKVLLAMYAEYQKDLPDMDEVITPDNLGLPEDVFAVAIEKLLNEGLITGAEVTRCLGSYDKPQALLFGAMVTPRGIDYVEEKLGIKATLSGKEKVEIVKKSFAEKGLEILADFTGNVIAVIIKSQAGQ